MAEPSLTSVDRDALVLRAPGEALVEVHLDGRRVWVFRVAASGEAGPDGTWRVPWPADLRTLLDARADLGLVVGGTTVHAGEVRFGPGERLALHDAEGRPLAIDNTGRLAVAFEAVPGEVVAELLDATAEVVEVLEGAGVEPFLAYGTLLGAHRDGRLIGHDNDIDLGYVSALDHPADLIRESYRLERVLRDEGRARGWSVSRYSGLGLKVDVPLSDGTGRGVDVFGGAFIDGRLLLMGEVWTPCERERLLPRGTVRLLGRDLPAPADTEHVLEILYGPHWRVPDPAFSFSTPQEWRHRLDRWFRGLRPAKAVWDRRYSNAHAAPGMKPRNLVRAVERREPAGSLVVDVGCGRGIDSLHLAQRGFEVVGLDFAPMGFAYAARRAQEERLAVEFHEANLLDLRQVSTWAARLARRSDRPVLLARHYLDATSERGRRHLWRFASMLLSGGGRAYVEFVTEQPDPSRLLEPLDADAVVADAEAAGGRVVLRRDLVVRRTGQTAVDADPDAEFRGCRLVVEW